MACMEKAYSERKTVRSVVAFLDILGFSEEIKKKCPGECDENLESFYDAFTKTQKGAFSPKCFDDMPMCYKTFSDNIVLGIPLSDPINNIGAILISTAAFQFYLAVGGFFVRGGITEGLYFMDENVVYGPALIEAHELESKLAMYPRVVLGDSFKQLTKEHGMGEPGCILGDYIIKSADGAWFVNYLITCVDPETPHEPNIQQLVCHAETLKEKLREYENKPRVHDKYIWSAHYHNWFCRERGLFDRHPDLRILPDEFGLSFEVPIVTENVPPTDYGSN